MARCIGTIKIWKGQKPQKQTKYTEWTEREALGRAPKARASFEVPKAQEASQLVDLAGNQIAWCHFGANGAFPNDVSGFERAQHETRNLHLTLRSEPKTRSFFTGFILSGWKTKKRNSNKNILALHF